MIETTSRPGTTLTLLYSPKDDGKVIRQTFTGLTPDDIVAVSAALAARRMNLPVHSADMEQLKESRNQQMRWYADRMLETLYDGMGRWFRWMPERVRLNTVQALMDYLRDITATWTSELIAAHAEVHRTHAQANVLRLRRAPVIGPPVRCRNCSATCVASDDTLPAGWTADDDGAPRCPAHRVLDLVKGSTD